jgi:hypothetical protein
MPITYVKPKQEEAQQQPEQKKPRPRVMTTNTGFNMPVTLFDRLNAYCERTGAHKSETMRRALVAFLNEAEKK